MPDDRLKRGAELFLRWRRLEYGQPPEQWTPEKTERFKSRAFDELLEVYEPEILQAILEDFVGCVLCDVKFEVENGEVKRISYPAAIASSGFRRAAATIAKVGKTRLFHEHVKVCTAEVLAEYQAEVREEWRRLSPEEILPHVVNRSRRAAAVLLENLTFKQREALLPLLIAQTTNESVSIRADEEPEDELLWRIWYTSVLLADDPPVKKILKKAERPTIVLLGEGWGKPLPEGKSAAPPLHANFYQQLVKELHDRGYPIKRPESRRRIARWTKTSRSTVDRYLASDARPESLRLFGKRWEAHITLDAIRHSVDAARGKKRGPRNGT